MISIKSRYSLTTLNSNYMTQSLTGSSVKMLTDVEFKEGKQGYIFVPYIMAETTSSIELPDYIVAEMKRDSLRKKLQKIKKL